MRKALADITSSYQARNLSYLTIERDKRCIEIILNMNTTKCLTRKACNRNVLNVVRYGIKTDSGRKKLVILGTGWGSYKVLRAVDKKVYDVIVVSPRNHFLFTPLLCSTTVGTLEFR